MKFGNFRKLKKSVNFGKKCFLFQNLDNIRFFSTSYQSINLYFLIFEKIVNLVNLVNLGNFEHFENCENFQNFSNFVN